MKFYFYNANLSSGLSFFINDEPDEESLSELLPEKFTFALPSKIEVTKLSFLLIKNSADEHVYIGKIFNKRRVTTFDNSLSIREVKRLYGIDLDKLIIETQGEAAAKRILESRYPVELHKNSGERIRDAILATNREVIDDNYFTFNRLTGSYYSDVIPQTVDSFNVAFSIFGIDPRDIPPLREEQILDFDIDSVFPQQSFRTPDGKHYFEHAGKRLYIQKVHNTPIEKCLGVDLIYNFMDEQRVVFIQYKCLNDGNDKKFYKSADRHFPEELKKMKAIPGVGNCYNFKADRREVLRICGCPVYVKLCAREIKGKRLTPYGFYYPICIWDYIYSSGTDKYITLNDEPRISNDQFIELVKAGLFGSTPSQSQAISAHLVGEAKDERLKLVFIESKQECLSN